MTLDVFVNKRDVARLVMALKDSPDSVAVVMVESLAGAVLRSCYMTSRKQEISKTVITNVFTP